MLKETTIHFYLFDESHFSNIFSHFSITFFITFFIQLDYETIKYVEVNWLCKNRKKVRRSQASISTNSRAELSKTKFSLRVSLIFQFCIKHREFPTEWKKLKQMLFLSIKKWQTHSKNLSACFFTLVCGKIFER